MLVGFCVTLSVLLLILGSMRVRAFAARGRTQWIRSEIRQVRVELENRVREQTEELRASEARFRRLTEGMPQLVWTTDVNGKTDYLSRQWIEYTGESDLDGWLTCLHPDDRERTSARWQVAVQGLAPYDIEYRIRRHDGVYRWFKARAARLLDEDGQSLRWFGTCTDIDDWKCAAAALEESERDFRVIFESAAIGICQLNPATKRCVRFNQTYCSITGYSPDELLGMSMVDLTHPDDRLREKALFDTLVSARGQSYEIEKRYIRKNGQFVWIHVNAAVVRDSAGRPLYTVGFVQDITLRKTAQEEAARLNEHLEESVHDRTCKLAAANWDLATEVQMRRHVEDVLRRSQERFEIAVRGSNDGLWDWDLLTNETYYSPRWKGMLGYAETELLNRHGEFERLTHPQDLDKALAAVKDYLEERSPGYGLEIRMRHKDGTYRWIFTRGIALRDKNGRPYRMAGSHTDITQRKAVELELQRAREAAEAANRAKSEFLANMSHEVRTPMNGIIGMTDLVLDTPLSADQRDCLGMVRESAEHLLRIINEILDFSKVEAGRLELEQAPFSLRDSLESAVRLLAVRARQKDLALSWHAAADVPDALSGDAGRLTQVLINLVGNAIKFTDAGSVNVDVECANLLAPGLQGVVSLSFTVRDTGIGIPADQIACVFEPFTQAESSAARRSGGTGLGLAIVARLVDLMGGRIHAASTPGQGSTFAFTANFAVAAGAVHAEPVLPASAGEGPTNGRPLRVLVAEDQPVNQRLVSRLLEQRGHSFVLVSSGREALERARHETFDVVLMDVQMPEMDGLTATAMIREHERGTGRHVPIVALTAHAMEGDRQQSIAAGCDAHLTKPIRRAELYRTIESLSAPHARVGRNAAGEQAETPPERPVFDRAEALKRVEGDDAFLKQLIGMFEERWPRQCANLRKLAAAGDVNALQRLARSAAGNLESLGAGASSQAALSLEAAARAGNNAECTQQIGRLEVAVMAFITAFADESSFASLTP